MMEQVRASANGVDFCDGDQAIWDLWTGTYVVLTLKIPVQYFNLLKPSGNFTYHQV
jgi:hypothetical protein